jgi:hypothetical protein
MERMKKVQSTEAIGSIIEGGQEGKWKSWVKWRDAYSAESSGRVGAGTEEKPTIVTTLSETGRGESVLGEMVLKVLPGMETGRILIKFQHTKR